MNGKDRTYSPYLDLMVADLLPKLPHKFNMKKLMEKVILKHELDLDKNQKKALSQRLRKSMNRLQLSNRVTLSHDLEENHSILTITKVPRP